MDGIINVLKPPGMTSHDVVSCVRRFFKLKRVGHAGTLDPAAAGVLPVFLGQATRLVEYLCDADKSYRVELIFGYATDTGDDTGKVIRQTEDFVMPDRLRLSEVLASFVGDIMQKPPMYSAVKIGGKRLYELARAGVEVERSPRPVSIFSISLVAVDSRSIIFDVTCSKGTYMRTLCEDIGEKFGLPAVMSFLVRTRVGQFSLAEAVTLEELQEKPSAMLLKNNTAVRHLPIITLSEPEEKSFKNGQALSYISNLSGLIRIYNQNQKFIGIAKHEASVLTAEKVFLR